ncbi:MAG: F0F1 ATP synthase subunit delta [Gammaproteobacteria bacterium]|jgi:F-type H+-transporting ATPase subunit delta|nr:F0F1 ATP synthase subunit delta [Gammaproteobacteria bacterium]
MAELSTLARPYAKAAFEYALDHDQLNQWHQQLATAAAVVADERVGAVLTSPALTSAQQAQKLGEVCGDALSAQVKNFVGILSANKRLALLPQIHELFALYKANRERTVDVEVVSAFELADGIRDRLAAALGRKLERQVNVQTSTDSNLLGGVVIKAGDLVIDGSVRGKLDKLAEAMTS